MDENFGLIKMYTTKATNMEEVKQSNSKYEGKKNQQWGEKLTTKELLDISTIGETTNIATKVDIL